METVDQTRMRVVYHSKNVSYEIIYPVQKYNDRRQRLFVYLKTIRNFMNHMSDLKDTYWEHDKKPDGAYVSSDRKDGNPFRV